MPLKISTSGVAALIRKLSETGRTVFAPVSRGEFTDFDRVSTLEEADLSRVSTRSSVKHLFFPPTEPVLSFALDGRRVALDELPPAVPRTFVVFGCRPCDAAALPILDKVFSWDCDDRFYLARRAAGTIISIACTDCDDACFCTALGLAPDSAAGSDILLTPFEDGYIVDPCSDKGGALAKACRELLGECAADRAEILRAVRKKLPPPMDLNAIKVWLDRHFDDDHWRNASFKCLGCGCCTYLCPTCHCFDIVDEADSRRGLRRRNWDSCQFAQFTAHASGHNPRPVQAARWRQRIMHKFSYYVDRFGTRSCVGCGRCIRSCPVQMDLKHQLKGIETQARGGHKRR